MSNTPSTDAQCPTAVAASRVTLEALLNGKIVSDDAVTAYLVAKAQALQPRVQELQGSLERAHASYLRLQAVIADTVHELELRLQADQADQADQKSE
jgi:hypothetical protein